MREESNQSPRYLYEVTNSRDELSMVVILGMLSRVYFFLVKTRHLVFLVLSLRCKSVKAFCSLYQERMIEGW